MRSTLIAGLFFLLPPAWAQEPVQLNFHAEARRSAAPLDVERIRQILQQNPLLQGLDLSQARIFPPPDFTTHVQNPELEIRRIQESPERNRLFITFRCRERAQCASFLVEAILPNPRAHDVSNSDEGLFPGSFSAGAMRKETIPAARGPVLVQPHTLAMLVIEEEGLRITEPVLPQKPARLGEIVRVKDPSARRSMMAKVIGPGLLGPAGENNQPQLGRVQ